MTEQKKTKKSKDRWSTKSIYFVLPMLEYRHDFYTEYLHDCFILTDPPQVVLVFNSVDSPKLVDVMEELHYNVHYLKEDVHKDKLLVWMSIPKHYITDFNKFVSGDYSKFSKRYKEIMKVIYGMGHGILHIINPTKKERDKLGNDLGVDLPDDAEIYSTPDLDKEIFNIKKI